MPILTTNFGFPLPDPTHSLNIGGHPVVSDVVLFEKQQTFNRAKIVERAVHACGSGAFGYFEVTHDLTHLCKAAFMSEVGKKTPLFARFSTVTYGREFPDSARNPRGLAWKLYTEEGNYDCLTVNFPSFFVRDPTMGPDNIRSQQRHPSSFKVDFDATFDFMSLVPESQLTNLWYWSDHGHPFGWRYTPAQHLRLTTLPTPPLVLFYLSESSPSFSSTVYSLSSSQCRSLPPLGIWTVTPSTHSDGSTRRVRASTSDTRSSPSRALRTSPGRRPSRCAARSPHTAASTFHCDLLCCLPQRLTAVCPVCCRRLF